MAERRFRVEVTTTVAHLIYATDEADAIAGAVEMTKLGVRPAYACEPSAHAEVFTETEAA